VRDAAVAAAGSVHEFVPALTSFVGRAGAVDEVAGLLGGYRLVTVIVPGGVGKTRLAGEVAKRVAGRFADGVWLVELAAVGEPLVPAAIAVAVGLHQPPGMSIAEALIGVLARRQLLLVLDNCEHVATAVAELCGVLLPAADDARVLATSREPVGIVGEARYRLPALTLPGLDDLAGVAAGSEAVALFAAKIAAWTRSCRPEFGEDAADVGLGGLLADRQDLGDLPVAVTAGDQREYFAFAR
jgi:predicted ATPase